MRRLEKLKTASICALMIFTFALITGVKNGWLDAKTYGPAARNTWIAVAGYIDQNQNITSVCEGTGKKNNYDYYMQRKRIPVTSTDKLPSFGPPPALLR